MAESEFRNEVQQSLERAFTEGHSVDNAAVELKTLRMASNVPLTLVREAVVAAIVEHIRLVEGGGAAQRKEIASVINRWGPLIDRIGGVDAVETISALQVTRCPFSYTSYKLTCDRYLEPLCVVETNAAVRTNTCSTLPR
jgi:translation initiation factor eIF-2B subunit epsilon